MSIDGGVSDGASEAGRGPGRPHLPVGIRVLAGQAEVQHVDLPHSLGSSTNWNITLEQLAQTGLQSFYQQSLKV